MYDISKPLVISLIFTINPGIWENSAFSQEQNVPFDAALGGAYSYNYSAMPLTGTLMTATSSTITIPYSNETLTTTAGRKDIGGNGVNASPENGRNEAGLGTGGSGLTITLNGDSATNSLTITPANSGAVGVFANSVGGNGGNGWDVEEGDSDGVDAGGGGGGGGIGITATGYVNITTSGENAIGVQAASAGGTGGIAGDAKNGPGNTGGYGGSGGDVKVDFSKSTAVITANGANAFGVLATSIAGDAGDNSANSEDGSQATGSHGGNSGTVDVTMGDSTTIDTSGANAIGIVARSVSGKGGMGGISIAHGTGDGGDGGNGGKTGVITLNADGTITTHGTGAMGIFAQAAAGGGGAGGASEATFGGDAGKAGNGGNPAAIYITNSGSITTNDGYAPGILGQSLSGAGGIGGSASGMFDANGGAGGTSPDAGVVNIIHSGTITTKKDNSQGIVAQSIAGGGGMGGDAGGMFDTHGGSGGTGGAGGTITLKLGGTIGTGGQNSHGVVAQSIGGGGGMGGIATGDGISVSVAVGGNGGTAGDGGPTTTTTNGLTLTAAGTASIGLLSQSIGGGGGSGGGAFATATGPLFAVGVAVGGTGGTGGSGGTSTVTVDNSSITTGTGTQLVTPSDGSSGVNLPAVDSHGVVSQSIGGGGGNGGAGSAASYAIALPNNLEPYYNITFSGAFALGGSGGDGGHGGLATATIEEGSTVSTGGDGSIGVMVQSIGGGGGNGGDSSSMASTIGFGVPIPHFSSKITPATNAVNVSLAIGGIGGSGGNGSTATFQLGNSDVTNNSSITTHGAEAIGALVQSVGGGGGNGGIGNANVSSYATSQNADFTIGLGGSGNTGGSGGTVTATIDHGNAITTHGHGSEGVLAQSIGGGGGVGSGSAINASGLIGWAQGVSGISPSKLIDDKGNKVGVGMNINPTVNVGATGAAGGDGGGVTVTHGGTIDTYGIDAAGIVAQSIGGGGGSGGTGGADSSTGVLPGASSSTAVTTDDPPPPDGGGTLTVPVTIAPTINVGGGEGASGHGNTVTVTPTDGRVTTRDDYSTGIIAQSIGGGGGRGAVVTVGTETGGTLDTVAELSVQTSIALGRASVGAPGAPSLGGSGDVTVKLGETTILTGQPSSAGAASATPNKGLHAYGILAQSIIGGGGVAIDGSPDPNGGAQLGLVVEGGVVRDRSETVGTVTLTDTGNSTISTQGDGAHGIVLQSISMGGGVLGVGSSSFSPSASASRALQVRLGSFSEVPSGSAQPSVDGGTVHATYTSALTTAGNGAFGIVAQSIGGGGGLVGASQGVVISALLSGKAASSNGGTVTVDLTSGSALTTTGVGSHGVVAQSIGGGGGVVASYQYGQVPKLIEGISGAGYGDGGDVTATTDGAINVSGAGAYGVLAQSVGGGGGMIAFQNGNIQLGNGGSGQGGRGEGGTVTVNVQGSVSATGKNGIGILAQSDGPDSSDTVTVNVGGDNLGTVTGGAGAQGVGILIAGGNSSNKITITENSWVYALSGTAIKAVGKQDAQKVDVDNQGQIYGNTFLIGGSISGNYQNTYGKPPTESAGTLTNSGVLVALPGKRSYVDGHLAQTATGHIAPHLDYSNLESGTYEVTGNAALDGHIRPNLASAMPDIFLPALTVNGVVTGALEAPDSPLFSYTLRENAGQYDIAITDTHFDESRFGLTEQHGAVAGALETVFASGDAELGAFFAGLDSSAGSDLALYRRALDTVAHENLMAVFALAAVDASRIADAAMSCPKFSTETGARAFLTEGSCIYAKAGGQTASLEGDSGRGEVDMDSAFWQVGGQTEIRPGLFLGGLLAYQTDWFNSRDGVSARGSSGQGALTLKYQTGPLLFTGAVFGSVGEYEIDRAIVAPGFSTTASSSPHSYVAGVRGRVAYTLGSEDFYLRPYLNIDLIHARSEGFSEDGAGGLGLRVDEVRHNAAVVTPAIEFGGRLQLSEEMVLRSYVSGGVKIRSNDAWEGNASFNGGSLDEGFSLDVPIDQISGRVSAGLQLFTSEHTDIRLQYDGEFGSQSQKHGASASLSYRF